MFLAIKLCESHTCIFQLFCSGKVMYYGQSLAFVVAGKSIPDKLYLQEHSYK